MNTFNLTGIKNIIFDLGGVILNIDYNKSVEEFRKLGIQEFENLYSQARQSNLFDDLEMGRIPYSLFREEIRQIAGKVLSDKQIDDAWTAMLLDLPAERITLLQQIKNNYNIYLLSNTNEYHISVFNNYLQETFNIASLDEIMHKAYYSHTIGKHKPDTAAFNYVIEDQNLNLAETLFIDDTLRHVEGARKAGLKAYHLKPSEDITTLF